ncbi:MAG TPA: GNAT family N-acetyltransferase [Salinivirga sp.]|uniref:GNAT family N-acetyltransferase n=1 Tax=Salinivirga sp. TaxID=1970192 RepID=UPI002B469FA2|nr:GNAT family N-acetyltransferase [Salinivirga sp.]HKK57974.1 GNAT family N-acetyltransferase [Salinivirga sp.]
MSSFQLFHNEVMRRYEFSIGKHTPYVQYYIKGDIIYLTFAKVPPALEGQGVGKELVDKVMEQVERLGLKVVPQCRFIAAVIKRNPRWRVLLAEN